MKFKIGDKIKSIKHNEEVYEVTDIFRSCYGLTPSNKMGTAYYSFVIDSTFELCKEIETIEKLCICHSHELFNYGCKCGGK